ncbi:hypothetical protein OIU77_029003 [Salix suchowensis]|uniref:Uncharacterized protein n=1 Tax=Salix suchowensis TaxID=1278906 RepID=A0ABQ9BLG8_9ROSI|nr:hypothetical protein OIU77_029003 [Salix suchowensis]
MEGPLNILPLKRAAPGGSRFNGNKRMRQRKEKVTDYSDPFAIHGLLDHLRMSHVVERWGFSEEKCNVIDLDDDDDEGGGENVASGRMPVVVIDSDDEEESNENRMTGHFQGIVLPKPEGQFPTDLMVSGHAERRIQVVASLTSEPDIKKDKGEYVGVEEDEVDTEIEDDGLGDIWKEMSFALESSKDVVENPQPDENMEEGEDYCEHSFVLKDDIGYVCRICRGY